MQGGVSGLWGQRGLLDLLTCCAWLLFQHPWVSLVSLVGKGSLRPNGKGEGFLRPPAVNWAPDGSLLLVLLVLRDVRAAPIDFRGGRSLPWLAFGAG